MIKRYTAGSLFAGIGGICLGFKQAAFDVIWANDFDHNACETYRFNKKLFPHGIIEEDIHKLKPGNFGDVDVITSGFPCQAFSIAGYQRGFNDSRGNLFFETKRFIDVLQPKAFLLENVKNLESHDGGKTLRIIREAMLESGYSFIPKVLNSMDYGNVPQNRERVYIIGFKGESEYKGCPDDKNICSSAFNFPSPLERTEQIADILEKKKVNSKYYYRNSLYFRQLSRTTWRKDTVYQWRRVYLRENKSNVCPTLTANMGTGGHNVPLICKSAIRKLTPRECARLQGFPEEFIFPVKMAQSHIYKQIGNSVTVPVIRRIAEKIKEALDVKYSYRIIPVNNTEKEALKIALVS